MHLIMRGDKSQFGNRRNKWEGRFEFYQANRFVAIAGDAWEGNADLDQTASLQHFLPVRQIDTDGQEIQTKHDERWCGPEDDRELLRRIFVSDEKNSPERIAEINDTPIRDPHNLFAKAEFDKLNDGIPFTALWNGDANVLSHHYPLPTGKPFDHSAADLALMNKLAFWTGKSPFGKSGMSVSADEDAAHGDVDHGG